MTQDDRVEYRELSSTSNVDSQQTTPVVACGASSSPSTTTSNTTATTDQQSSLLFDYVDQQIDEELVCPICVYPFIDPITHSSCGNTFCSECIQSISNCPLCSEGDFKKNCSPSAKTIRNLLDKLKVKCDMCKNTVLRGELKDHKEKYCPLHDAYKQVDELKLKLEAEFNQKNEQLKSEYFELIKQLKDEKEQTNQRLKKEHDQLIQQLKDEKEQSIKDAKENLILKERELILKVKSSEEALKKERELFDRQVLVREKFESSNKPIHLNVRGTIMTVSLGDFIHNEIEPDNLFKKMFTGKHPMYETPSNTFKDSVYYIDCKPMIFEHILEWLKFGSIPIELSVDIKNSLLNSSKMFKLNNLSKKLDDTTNNSTEKLKLSQLDFIHLNHLGLKLTGIDLRGLALQKTNLERSEVISSDFSGMNLKNAKFKGSNLSGSNFSNCDLTNVDFNGCDLSECDLSNAILQNTDMSNTNLSRASFENAKLEHTKFQSCKFEQTLGLNGSELISLDFTKSTFIECSFKHSDLTNSNFSNTTLSNCNLENTILKSSNFDNSQFKNVKFNSDCIFVDCILSGCNLSNQDFTGFQFKNVNFTNSVLDGSNFENVTFNKCSIKLHFKKNMFLKDCKLINCNWNGSIFEEIDYNVIESLLLTSLFNECTFKNCDLTLLKDLSKFIGIHLMGVYLILNNLQTKLLNIFNF